MGMMSMDWDFISHYLDEVERYYSIKTAGPSVMPKDERAMEMLRRIRQQFNFESMRKQMRHFYPNFSKETRLIDVIHHMGTARLNRLPRRLRQQVVNYKKSFLVQVKAVGRRNEVFRDLNDSEVEQLAERIARLYLINDLYGTMERTAEDIIELDREVDQINEMLMRGSET